MEAPNMKSVLIFLMIAVGVLGTSMAQVTKQDLVDLHNVVRADVGVEPVAWDDTVAAYAQAYADERRGDCQLEHSDSGGKYGENLFRGSAGANWTAADVVGAWVEEKQWYDHDTNNCSAPAGRSCLHYTQIVWRATTAIGCGGVVCDNDASLFITCNYSPPGNIEGESPY